MALDTRDLIHSNFNLDLAVNSALLFAATFGWLPPLIAALLHNGTTLAILARSLKRRNGAASLFPDSLAPGPNHSRRFSPINS